jgi:hypothetical protein
MGIPVEWIHPQDDAADLGVKEFHLGHLDLRGRFQRLRRRAGLPASLGLYRGRTGGQTRQGGARLQKVSSAGGHLRLPPINFRYTASDI